MRVASSVTELIGGTPMLRLRRLTGVGDASVYAKLESCNIGGSVKDRTALYLVEYAEASGRLSRGKVILEATSGNTGAALAMIGAAKGYRVALVMPESVSAEKLRMARAYDADVILTPAAEGTGGAVEVKRRMLAEDPERYVDIDQFSEPANILAHYQTLGREIMEQLGGRVDSVVVGIGTSGTGAGVSMRVKEQNPEARIVGVTPRLGVPIPGLRNPSEPNPTRLFRPEYFDEVVEISRDELPGVVETARCVARHEGLLVGYSGGAVLYQALREARRIGAGRNVVAIVADGGEKYLSTDLFID